MQLKIVCLLIGLSLAVGEASGLAALPEPNPSISVSSRLDAKDSYIETRWIGIRDKGTTSCPAVADWNSEDWLDRVLDRAGLSRERVDRRDRDLLRELGLDRFCVYTPTTDLPRPFIPPPGLVAQKDRMALSANATPLKDAVWRALAETFLTQTGRSSLQLAVDPRARENPTVRLTFIDSQPDSPDGEWPSATPPAGSQHGYTLAHLARALVCPETGPCAARLASRRALQHQEFDPHKPLHSLPASEGGRIGSIDDLASAITAEILHWRQGDSKHLILNLSVGWDGELELLQELQNLDRDLDARQVDALEPSVQGVHQALRLAQERDVLVIAAAGNRRGGPDESNWPVLPAAWELRSPSSRPIPFRGKPVVYAVGGVDSQGLPLPNSRIRGLPQRVAFADHAVAEVRTPGAAQGPGKPTAIYTGSSVSTAVVSSVAAVIWHLRPELSPSQVMELIDRSAEPVDSRASFYSWRTIWPFSHLIPAPPLRQVSLCRAVAHACPKGGASCPALEASPACPRRRPPALETDWVAMSWPPEYHPASVPPSFSPPCEPVTRLWSRDGNVPENPCPTEQFISVSSWRWVRPQPEDNPCPSCSLFPKPPHVAALSSTAIYDAEQRYFLAIEIDPAIPPSRLLSATLDLDCFEGGELTSRRTYPIDLTSLSPGALWPLPDLEDRETLLGCRAQLNFVVEKDGEKRSVQSPVAISP